MLRVWQKRLLNNRESVQYDFTTSGAHSLDIKAGTYDVWLVAGGAGGALIYNNSTTMKYVAKGGVGGVICARINIPRDLTITINVGRGGVSRMVRTSEGSSATGDNGQNSSITGIPNLTLVAGGGTSASASVNNPVAGIQGTNTATGANLVRIIENNVNTIISEAGQSSSTQRLVRNQANTNWAENTDKGSGGTVGWDSNSAFRINPGKMGLVRIKSVY